MSFSQSRWRAPVTGAVAGLAVAAAVVGPSALASGGTHSTPNAQAAASTAGAKTAASTPNAKAADAAGAPCAAPGGANVVRSKPAPGAQPSPAPFLAAVAQLVQAGTINESQARVLDAGIRAGRIDPGALVASGTLSSAQMQAIISRLGAVKRSIAPPGQGNGAPPNAHAKKAHK